MITYKTGNLSQIDIDTRRQLFDLSLGIHGGMIEPLIKHLPKVIIIAYDGETPVGWSVHLDSRNLSKDNKHRWLAYIAVFVNPVYRRMGIGKELVNRLGEALKSQFDFLVMMPRDPNGYVFFKKTGAKQWYSFPEDDWNDEFGRLVKPIEEAETKITGVGPKWDYITGYINVDHDVVASDEVRQHEGENGLLSLITTQYGIHKDDAKWRCHKDDAIVRWYDMPTKSQQFHVEEFLKHKYNVRVKRHVLYGKSHLEDFKENNQPMYKRGLKHSLFLGVVRQGDAVEAVDVSDEENAAHYDYRMMYGCRWRYDSGNETVDWTNTPTNDEKIAVENWLNRRGYEIKHHDIGKEKRFKRLTEIKQMIMEGVKEKTLEDFIKKIIQGTEWQGKVFIAGGYVRDEFMGKDPKDLDLLVNAPSGGLLFAVWLTKKVGAYNGPKTPLPPPPSDMQVDAAGYPRYTPGTPEELQSYMDVVDNYYSQMTNPVVFPRFGTAKFNLRGVTHNGIDISDIDIEAVMPRKEKYIPGSRKPIVTGGGLKDDVERRDFTVNSLLKDLSTGEILDLTGMGKADIKAGIIRTPLNPDKIFTDDPLRMLRAVRFAVKYDWKLPLFMIRGLKKNASQLKNISQERIRDELNKILITGSPSKGVKLLKITGLLPFVIPELVPAIRMTQNVHHKHDVFQHTLDVLSKTEPILVQRLMALFHDIGKTVTRSVEPETKGVHFYGHELAGERIVDDVMTRLKYPRELINAVKLGVRNHMRLKQSGDTGVHIKDKTLLKFRNEMGEQLENVLNLMHADNVSHSDASSMPNQITNIRRRLEQLKDVPIRPKMPIDGFDLTLMGLKPGPIFKEIMNAVAEAWYENPNLSKEQALTIAKKVAKI